MDHVIIVSIPIPAYYASELFYQDIIFADADTSPSLEQVKTVLERLDYGAGSGSGFRKGCLHHGKVCACIQNRINPFRCHSSSRGMILTIRTGESAMRIKAGDLVTYSDHFAKEHGHMPQTSGGGLVIGIVTEPTIIGAENTFYSVRWMGQSIDRLSHSDNLRKIVNPLLEID